jgi:hypothetical protein
MHQSVPTLFDAFGAFAGVLIFGFAGLVALASPVMLVSLVLNVRKIARELQRANDYREHYEHGVRPGPLGT